MLIVGLGNPTSEYENTFHNMGYKTIDTLANIIGKKIVKSECHSLTAIKDVNGDKIILAKPLTYMNLSGQAVKELMAKYKQTKEDIIIIYDDIDIPRYSVRTRANGSGGTHNGMRNIIELINTNEFKRIRIGIGKNEYDLKDYVLSKIPKEDIATFDKTFEQVSNLLLEYINTRDFDKLLRESNTIK
jgi:PTH1 family peptidyl-tRNA hydrolase